MERLSGSREEQQAFFETVEVIIRNKGSHHLVDLVKQNKNSVAALTRENMLARTLDLATTRDKRIDHAARTAQEQEGGNRLKKFMYMMDSMTDAELDAHVDLNKQTKDMQTRIIRIAKGSGTHPTEVVMLLKCHKQFEGVVKKMGKTNLLNDAAVGKQISRNPNQVMSQLSRAMDPRMLQQMGGAENMMKMMKQMGNMDMSQMGDLAKMMG